MLPFRILSLFDNEFYFRKSYKYTIEVMKVMEKKLIYQKWHEMVAGPILRKYISVCSLYFLEFRRSQQQ